MSEAAAERRRWSAGTLTYTLGGILLLFFLLLAGDFIWSMRERSTTMISLLLIKELGASDFLNSLIIYALPCAVSVVVCPLISYRSDRHRGRFGRRIPYLFLTTPIVFAGLMGMAFCVPLGELLLGTALGEWLGPDRATLLVFGAFWTLFEFGAQAGNVLFTALINDVVPRKLLGRFYGMFRIMSLLAGIIFNYKLLGYAKSHYSLLFMTLGIAYAVGFTLMCFLVKEGEYPPVSEAELRKKGPFAAMVEYCRECFSSRYYLLVFVMIMLAGITFAPVNSFCVFFSEKLNVPLDNFGKYTAWSFIINFALSYPLGMLADRFHPLRCCIAAMALYAVTALASAFFITNEATFAVAFILHCVLSGAYFTLSASLPMRLFPQERFAQFNSASWIILSLASVVVPPAVAKFLDLSGHEYRWIYPIGSGLAVLTVIAGIACYRRFLTYGGPAGYLAPEA